MVEHVVCADWSARPSKRVVFEALVPERVVRCVPAPDDGWTFERLITTARRRDPGRTLVAIDAPFGVPTRFLAAARRALDLGPDATLLELIRRVPSSWFEPVTRPGDWSVARPFFKVPKGRGALTAFATAASAAACDLVRAIDRTTGAKSVFITSGIPGSVGSSAIDLWRSLAAMTAADAPRVWPFDGRLDTLLATAQVVVAELYPRALYATALLDEPPSQRPRLLVAKTVPAIRRAAVTALVTRAWFRDLEVRLEDARSMEENEDAFDAGVSALGLLRSMLADEPLSNGEEPVAEGGILGTGAIRLDQPERRYSANPPRR